MHHFADRLFAAVRRVRNPVVVGIDPRLDWLPEGLVEEKDLTEPESIALRLASFCDRVFEVIAGKVAAVKFQMAFFEQHGPLAMSVLGGAAAQAHELGLLVILDGKRNDIGSTAEAYAEAYLTGATNLADAKATWRFSADALTINPYLGSDGVKPFVEIAAGHGTGLYALVRTSNPSAREFQDLICDGKPLYRHVAERVRGWAEPHRGGSGYSLVGAVVGATYPHELAELRAAMPAVPLLVPGYGAQGGTAADVAAAFDENGLGAIVNNSRGLVFAYREPKYRDRFGAANWQRAIEASLDDMIADLAANTPAGRLRA